MQDATVALIQGSLNPGSRTAIVVREVQAILEDRGVGYASIDLRELELQFCDGRTLTDYNEDMQRAHATLARAGGFVIGMPVYNYSVAGPLKNFLDITIGAMRDKVCGIIANSGGVRSYLAAAELMKLLSFEVSAISVQPVVHTWSKDFEDGAISSDDIRPRLVRMIDAVLELI